MPRAVRANESVSVSARPGPAVRAVCSVLVLLLALAGCGVSREDAPRALAAGQVPFSLASEAPQPQFGLGQVGLYFVRDGKVTLAIREVTDSTPTSELIQLLLEGPLPSEQTLGYTTELVGVRLAGVAAPEPAAEGATEMPQGVAVVSLESVDKKLTPTAVAQIVATLAPNRASGVRFELDGTKLQVPRGTESELDATPLDRADVSSLLADAALATPSPVASGQGALPAVGSAAPIGPGVPVPSLTS